jgi:hypothetical protein
MRIVVSEPLMVVMVALLVRSADCSVDCTGWIEPCKSCTNEQQQIHYRCLSIGRGDGGEDDCNSRQNCTWYQDAGSNYWSGGSLQCTVDLPAVTGNPSAQSFCCEGGQEEGTTSCYPLGAICPDCLLPDGWGSVILWILLICVLLCCAGGCYLCFTRQHKAPPRETVTLLPTGVVVTVPVPEGVRAGDVN